MIDSHCHLDHQPLSENLDEVLNRSKNIGIMFCIAQIFITLT